MILTHHRVTRSLTEYKLPSGGQRKNSVSSVVKPKTQTLKLFKTMNKEIWKKILNIAITILTAIATTFGVSSCMGN